MNVSRTLMTLIISATVLSSTYAQQQPPSSSPLGKLFFRMGEALAESQRAREPKPALPEYAKSSEQKSAADSEPAWLGSAPIEKVAQWIAEGIVKSSKAGDFTPMLPYIDGRQLASNSVREIAKDQDSIKIFSKSPGYAKLAQVANRTMIGLMQGSMSDSSVQPMYQISNVRRQSAHSASVDIERLDLEGYQHRTLKITRNKNSVGITDVLAPTLHLSARNYLQYVMIADPEPVLGLGDVISESRLLQSPDVTRLLALIDTRSGEEFVESFEAQRELLTPAARNWRIVTFFRCILSLKDAESEEAHTHYAQMKQTVTDPDSAAWAGLRYGIRFGDAAITNRSLAAWQRRHRPTQLQWLEFARLAADARDTRLAKRWLAKVHGKTLKYIPAIAVGSEIALRTGDHQRLGQFLDQLDREHDVQLFLDLGSDDWEAFEQSAAYRRQQELTARRWADLPSYERGVPKPNLHQMTRFAAASNDDSIDPPELIEKIAPEAVSTWIEGFELALKERDQESMSRLIAWDVGLQREIMLATDSQQSIRDSLKHADLVNYARSLNERLRRYPDMTLITVQAPLGLIEVVYRVTDPKLDYLIFRLMPSRDGIVATEIRSISQGDSFCRAEADSILWASLRLKAVRGKLLERHATTYRYLQQRQRASLPSSQRRRFDAIVDGEPVWDVSDPVILRQAIAESRTEATKLRWLHLFIQHHNQRHHVAWQMIRDPSLADNLNVIDGSLGIVQGRIGGDPFLDLVLASSLVDIDACGLAELYAEGVDTDQLNLPRAHELRMKVMIASGQFDKAADDFAALRAKGLHGEALHRVGNVTNIDDFLNSTAFKDAGRIDRGGKKTKWNDPHNAIQEL